MLVARVSTTLITWRRKCAFRPTRGKRTRHSLQNNRMYLFSAFRRVLTVSYSTRNDGNNFSYNLSREIHFYLSEPASFPHLPLSVYTIFNGSHKISQPSHSNVFNSRISNAQNYSTARHTQNQQKKTSKFVVTKKMVYSYLNPCPYSCPLPTITCIYLYARFLADDIIIILSRCRGWSEYIYVECTVTFENE